MNKAKILVVDDEQSILNLVEAYLRPEGYEVQTAMDGESALAKARAFKPDVLVLDIMLPVKDGIEVLTALRRESAVPEALHQLHPRPRHASGVPTGRRGLA